VEGGVQKAWTEDEPEEDKGDVGQTAERQREGDRERETEEFNIMLEGKEIRQGNGFVYLGGKVTGDGHSKPH